MYQEDLSALCILCMVAACLLLISGCLQQPVTPEQDSYGCRNSANQTWCPVENRCIVRGQEPCSASLITTFRECEAAGYPVMESYPRQCRGPGGQILTEDILEQRCMDEGGHWNECSSRCRLDNANRTDVACPAVCDALCECSGIAGFQCPEGYHCHIPLGIADALGYCVPHVNLTAEQAFTLAQNSTCMKEGDLTGGAEYNSFTRSWWLKFTPSSPHPGCNPACVVDEATETVEINWRCTGLVPPRDDISGTWCTAPGGERMTLGEALHAAQTGECGRNGLLTDRHSCNEYTGTWWIDLEPSQPKAGCTPACVVHVVTGMVEVNWRCTGLLPL